MGMSTNMAELYALPNQFISNWKAQGKKVLGTVCCHIPEELLHAAGILPIRIRATGCDNDTESMMWMSTFSCSFARCCLEQLQNGTLDFLDGILCSDGCNMIQRMYDNWNYVDKNKFRYELRVPRVLSEDTIPFFQKELEMLKQSLEEWTGNKITEEKLRASIALYNETRALIRKLYDLRKDANPVISGADCLQWTLASMSMPKEDFNELLSRFLQRTGDLRPVDNNKARLMLIGSAMDEPSYMNMLEETGGLIVTDMQCYGKANLWEPVSGLDAGSNTWFSSLAESYLAKPTCPRMCNLHDEIYDAIVTEARKFKVDGIVFIWMKNCDIWGGESIYILDKLKEAGIPVLAIEREQILSNAGQVTVRAEAFIEMIEGRKH